MKFLFWIRKTVAMPILVILSFFLGVLSFFFIIWIAFCNLYSSQDLPTTLNLAADLDSALVVVPSEGRIDTIVLDSVYYSHMDRNTTEIKSIRSNIFLNTNPRLMTWILFNAAVVAFCITFLFPLGYLIYDLNKNEKSRVTFFQGWGTLIIAFGLFTLIYCIFHNEDFKGHYLGGADLMWELKLFFKEPVHVIEWFNNPPLIVSCIAVFTILAIVWVANNYFSLPIDDPKKIRAKYKQLKSRLNGLIAFLGIAVSGTTVGSGMQRQLFLSVVRNGERLYPIEFVYSFGFVFALILFLLYVPSFLFLQEKARVALFRATENTTDMGKEEVGQVFNESIVENLKVALSISLPVLSSIVQNLFFGVE